MLIFIFALSHAYTVDSHSERQAVLIESFFANISEEKIRSVSAGKPFADICDWDNIKNHFHVSCESGSLNRLYIIHKYLGALRMQFLPGTIERLRISGCGQRDTLDTRMLPRKSRVIDLNGNQMHGSLDCTTLPENLEVLNIQMNHFRGALNFTHLPHGLRSLYFARNRFAQEILYYATLPKTIETINLWGNAIYRVEPLSEDEVVARCGVFTISQRPG